MDNGIYAALKTDCAVHAVFIDQDNVEFGQLNRKMRANRQKQDQALANQERQRAAQIAAADKAFMAEEARKRKIRRITARTVKQELCLATAMAVVYGGFYAGLVSVFFAIPVLAILLAAFCFKAGSFFGRIFQRRR